MYPAVQVNERRTGQSFTTWCVWAGAVVLAVEPARWLVGTWYRAGYDGIGWVAFALVVGLAGLSIRTPVIAAGSVGPRTYGLLLVTAIIRLVAQVLDVNVIGALLLAVDVYALAQLGQLNRRRFALSPFWLAVVFCFSLPIEPMVQRVLGYDLQHISATLACGFLQPFFDDLACVGVRLKVDGVDVLVDLPCSGAELVSISALMLALINCLRRPGVRWGLMSCVVCLTVALLGNGLRIALLAAGIVYADHLVFFVMDPVPHTAIGLVVVAFSAMAVLSLSKRYPKLSHTRREQTPRISAPTLLERPTQRLAFAGSFLVFAVFVGGVQPQPVDASVQLTPPQMPWVAAGLLRQPAPLSRQEEAYFTRYGGGATRASFGPYGLLLVSTSSPLRHLHDPTICLTGMGYAVSLLGTDHAANSTVYLATRTDPSVPLESGHDPERYRVRVSYQSSAGRVASSVSEVVWHWLREPASTWTMVQRIVPEHLDMDASAATEWEHAIQRAFDLT